MESVLIYLGKAAVATTVLFFAYLVLFQNKKQFLFNRIYLLSAFVVSYLVPLIVFTAVKYVEATDVQNSSYAYLTHPADNTVPVNSISLWPHYLLVFYLAGTFCFLFLLITGHLKALQILRRSRSIKLFGCNVYVTDKDVHPFSFLNNIIIPQRSLNSGNLQMIVEHEKFHVQKKHTLDILLVEMLFMFQWFNPFAWLLREAVRNNLEYETDNEVIARYNPFNYQMAMVAQAGKKGVAPFFTAMNGSQLKSRIIMMKKKPHKKYSLVKKLVVLPLLAVLVMGLSERVVITEVVSAQDEHISNGNTEIQEALVQGKFSFEEVESLPEATAITGRTPEEIISGNDEFNARDTEVEPGVSVNGGDVTQRISKGLINHDEVQYLNSDTVQIRRSSVPVQEIAEPDTGTFRILSDKEPLYIIDGNVTKHINQISPDDIEKIDVLKGPSGIELYGPKASNGVVLITTKSKAYSYLAEEAQNVRPQPAEEFAQPDEWPQFPGGEEAMHQFISSNIRYPESARENGIQGRVFVTLKVTKEGKLKDVRLARGVHPPLDQEALRVISSMPDWKPALTVGKPVEGPPVTVPVVFAIKDPVVKVKSYSNSLDIPGPLYIVDGVETKNIKEISPDDIKHIEVLKSESATALYGQRGKDGVIKITTIQGSPDNKIVTEMQLRQFIAKSIKYPVEAQKDGLNGKTSIVIDPGKNYRIAPAENFDRDNVINLPDVVVVGYGGDKILPPSMENTIPSLLKEVERVVQTMPRIEIPGLEGKPLRLNVLFQLQNED